jgi:hypothetical protein
VNNQVTKAAIANGRPSVQMRNPSTMSTLDLRP